MYYSLDISRDVVLLVYFFNANTSHIAMELNNNFTFLCPELLFIRVHLFSEFGNKGETRDLC